MDRELAAQAKPVEPSTGRLGDMGVRLLPLQLFLPSQGVATESADMLQLAEEAEGTDNNPRYPEIRAKLLALHTYHQRKYQRTARGFRIRRPGKLTELFAEDCL
jgi:hypothetical protein